MWGSMTKALNTTKPSYATKWPLTIDEINQGIETSINIEQNSKQTAGFLDKTILDLLAKVLIYPFLRTDFDKRFARGIILSLITFCAGATLSIMYSQIWIKLIAALVLGYGSHNMNYVLHQHAHVKLTHNRYMNLALDYYLSLTVGMTIWHWRLQHILGHHGHGKNPQFGELHPSDYTIDRRRTGGFLKIFIRHDITRSLAVLFSPIAFMIKALLKGEQRAQDRVSDEKILDMKKLLKKAGMTDTEMADVVFDKHVSVNYVAALFGILAVWTVIGLLVFSNIFLLFYYALIQILTKCTDVINHTYPDGSGKSSGMINLSPNLAHKTPGFTWHSVHHLFGILHPQHYAKITQYLWVKGDIDMNNFELCDLQPGADNKVLTREILKGLKNVTLKKLRQTRPQIPT